MIVDIAELLRRAGEFEERLGRYYAAIRDASADNGVRLLTYYLSRHRRHLQEALKDFDADALQQVGKIKLKHDVEFQPEKDLQLMSLPPSAVKGKDILEAAVRYDTTLVELYRRILRQPLAPAAGEMLESLIRVEERDIVMLKKMIAMDYF
jgi:hypothetical protein